MRFYKRIINRIKLILFKDKLIYLVFKQKGVMHHCVGYFQVKGKKIQVFYNYKEGAELDSIFIEINYILSLKKVKNIESL